MKKRLFIVLVCQMLTTVGALAVTRTAILRIHNGTGITYDTEQLAKAVNEAENGDTLCLNEGTYNLSDTLVIDKAIALMGSGQSTHIVGNINIAIDGEPTLTSRMLDAIRITGSVYINKKVTGLSMRKVRVSQNLRWRAKVSDVLLDRCDIYNHRMDTCLVSANFVNCRFYRNYIIPNPNCEVTFLNCSIYETSHTTEGNYIGGQHVATYINTILTVFPSGYAYALSHSILNNVLSTANISGENMVVHDCYYDSSIQSASMDNYTSKTKDELIAAGYLGNDGTVVGVEGGNTPYTLVPSSIIVTESLLKVDNANKKLNVTLKVTSN